MCCAGARPNFMKIKPVMDAFERRAHDVVLVHTEQHYDYELNEVFFRELEIRPPDHHLGVGSAGHAQQVASVMLAFEPLVDQIRPDLVLVVGDVNSTLGCALVAAKSGALLGHVEAGLRSGDWSMPEEVNRVVTDRLSDLLFAPSSDAVANLRQEGFREDQIRLVGNVMIDTLVTHASRVGERPILADLGLEPGGFGLITLHRPSNVDQPEVLSGLLQAFERIGAELPLILPAHPRTCALLNSFDLPRELRVIEPLGYLDFLTLESTARVVLTDSGGVQEETTVLGVACLTLRDTTERPITVTEGTNRVVGTSPDSIVNAVQAALTDTPQPRRPELWDGRAAERIADVVDGIDVAAFKRPTEKS